MNISRRFFLGGAISLIAATTFKPAIASNMPRIYGDSVHDDSYGFGALFRNEPVIFNHDQLGVEEHNGIIFHHGRFVINNTVHVPKIAKIDIEASGPFTFIGPELPDDFPFFICEGNAQIFETKRGPFGVKFDIPKGKRGYLITNQLSEYEHGYY